MRDLEKVPGFIYKIVTPDGNIYIGQTINIKKRRYHYKYLDFKGQIKLWNYCQKYNWNPINGFEIIEECLCGIEKINLNEKEQYWIKFYDSFQNGLNCSEGGAGSLSRKHSEETKERLRQANLGKKYAKEVNAKKGTPRTEEQKEKIGNLNRGKECSKDHKKAISKAQKENKNMLGKKLTDEQKEKIRKSKIGKKLSEEHKKLLSQKRKEYFLRLKNEKENINNRTSIT